MQLYMLMLTIIHIKQMYNMLTAFRSIFLYRLRPTMPPPIPPATISAKASHSKGGTLPVTRVVIRLAI